MLDRGGYGLRRGAPQGITSRVFLPAYQPFAFVAILPPYFIRPTVKAMPCCVGGFVENLDLAAGW